MVTFKERRKIIENIPKDTPYCYTPISDYGLMENGKWGYKIKPCPYFKFIETIDSWCKLYKCDVEDQCKSCGLRFNI